MSHEDEVVELVRQMFARTRELTPMLRAFERANWFKAMGDAIYRQNYELETCGSMLTHGPSETETKNFPC